MRARFVLLILTGVLSLHSVPAMGVRAYPFPVTVTQPDGSLFTFIIHGDESSSYKTSLDGRPVVQDSRGFYRYEDKTSSVIAVKEPVPSWSFISVRTKVLPDLRTIVIPVQFKDLYFTTSNIKPALFNLFNQMNYSENGATGSVRDYFRDNLGLDNLTFEVADPVFLDKSATYYGSNEGGVTDANVREMVRDACEVAHSNGVDFSQYDCDGDGVVDNVFFIFAGHNEAEGGGDDCIWPQSWNVLDMDIRHDGVQIGGFSLYSEYSGAQGYDFAGIGSICHEYCHLFGLKDMYDVNGPDEGMSRGLGGTLSIMDYGNYNNSGKTPPYLTSFERVMLGVTDIECVRPDASVVIKPVYEDFPAFVLHTGNEGEEYFLEYRDGTKWDRYIGGTGLLICHIDRSQNRAGSMSASARWEKNAVNACADHPCADCLVSSDRYEDASDFFFPGKSGRTMIHSSVCEPLRVWNGDGLGVGITDLEQGAGGVSCKLVKDEGWSLPAIVDYYVIPGQTTARLVWEQDRKGMGEWVLSLRNLLGTETSVFSAGNLTEFNFTELFPGEDYLVTLRYSQGDLTGRPYQVGFKTIKSLNDFPLIGGLDKGVSTGDELRLNVLNLTEEVVGVKWYVNGVEMDSPVYEFRNPGKYRIEAVISYADGTEETLSKNLTVNE